MTMTLAGIEAGGTKFVCVIGNAQGKISERLEIPTKSPAETMPQVIEFFKTHPFEALGIGSFGPIDLHPSSKTYGFIMATPKTDWRHYDFVGTLKKYFKVPMQFDTDVNGAALGEYYWGRGKNIQNFIYLTIGTGIGGGVINEGKLLHGLMHPEMGHILVPRSPHDTFKGICPYHQHCLEGLASGPALKARWDVASALDLNIHHPAWDLESDYLAAALMNYILCFSPERIILGGGVMKQTHLLPMIQEKTKQLLAGYLQNASIDNIKEMIVLAGLGQDAGSIGTLALAKLAILKKDFFTSRISQ